MQRVALDGPTSATAWLAALPDPAAGTPVPLPPNWTMAWVRPRLWITPVNRNPAGRLGVAGPTWGRGRGAKGSWRPWARGSITCWGEGKGVNPEAGPRAARPGTGAGLGSAPGAATAAPLGPLAGAGAPPVSATSPPPPQAVSATRGKSSPKTAIVRPQGTGLRATVRSATESGLAIAAFH